MLTVDPSVACNRNRRCRSRNESNVGKKILFALDAIDDYDVTSFSFFSYFAIKADALRRGGSQLMGGQTLGPY